MDDQERLARVVDEARDLRVMNVMTLVLEIIASNPSPPRPRREQSASAEPSSQIFDAAGDDQSATDSEKSDVALSMQEPGGVSDDGLEFLIRMERRRRILILMTIGVITAALLSPLVLLLLL